MIKLFVTDIDGTLVKDGSGSCSPSYFPLIETLSERGCKFVAASGRQYTSLNKMFAPVSEQMYYISESGGILWQEGKPQVMNPIPYETVQELAEDVRKLKTADLMLSGSLHSYVPIAESQMHKWVRDSYGYEITVVDNWTFPKEEQYVKAAIYHPDNVEEITQGWFFEKWNRRLHLCLAGTMWMDCVMPGINKGTTLKLLQEKLGITKEETAVFADNQNDLEMFSRAKYTYAVETAREEVKQAAKKVIPSYEEEGVRRTIEMLLEHGLAGDAVKK